MRFSCFCLHIRRYMIKYLIMDKILSKLRAFKRRERIYGIRNPLTYDFLHHNLHHLHVLLFHSADQQDFTRGAILRQLLVFMLPILLSQLLQQFYTIADTALVGQVLGAQALAAVSSSPSSSISSSGSRRGSASSSPISMEKRSIHV